MRKWEEGGGQSLSKAILSGGPGEAYPTPGLFSKLVGNQRVWVGKKGLEYLVHHRDLTEDQIMVHVIDRKRNTPSDP